MPAIYAHTRFGKIVAKQLEGELEQVVSRNYAAFQTGLQGPDIFFFYRPWNKNRVNQYGFHLHKVSAMPFFRHGVKVVRKKGTASREYAYLLGFLCHFILDSECHPYVTEMIEKTGIQHLEIEEEFEKMLMRMDGKNDLTYPQHRLVPTDWGTAAAVSPFYNKVPPKQVRSALKYMRMVRRLFWAPGIVKQSMINGVMRLTGKFDRMKGLMIQRKDHPGCRVTNEELMRRFNEAVGIALVMIQALDESVRLESGLPKRLDRNFE